MDANVYSILSTVSPSTWFFPRPPCSDLTVFPLLGPWATNQVTTDWNHTYSLAYLLSLMLDFSITTVFQGGPVWSYSALWSFFILHQLKCLWANFDLFRVHQWSYGTVHRCDLKVRYRHNVGGWYRCSPAYVAPFSSLALLSPDPGGTMFVPYRNPYYSCWSFLTLWLSGSNES